jgi:hypothetical protein
MKDSDSTLILAIAAFVVSCVALATVLYVAWRMIP